MDVNVNYEIRIECIEFQKFLDTNSPDPEYIKKDTGNTYNLLGDLANFENYLPERAKEFWNIYKKQF